MPNTSVPAAAEGVSEEKLLTALLRSVDKINEARSFIDLLGYALDAMSSANDREINAIQYGLKKISDEVDLARDMVEDARRLEGSLPWEEPEVEMAQLEASIRGHEEAVRHSLAVADGSQQENEEAYQVETDAFSLILGMQCKSRVSRIRKVNYVLSHLNRNKSDLELDHYQLEALLESLVQ